MKIKNNACTGNFYNYLQNKNTYIHIFLLIQSICLIVFLVYNFYTQGEALNSKMLNAEYQFNDYFRHVGYASAPIGTDIYAFSSFACFPPLAYVMYAILARLTGYEASDPTAIFSHMYVGNNLTIYLVYTIASIILLLYALSLFLKKGFIYQVLFPLLLITSYPFAFSSLQRGNPIMLVSVLLCIAIAWHDDESSVKQEIAMIIIAICAGLKIYPAIFGLIYLKEKRYKQACRLLIYGLIFFFVPFVFFGGVEGMHSFIKTLLFLNDEVHIYSIRGIAETIMEKMLGGTFPKTTWMIQQLFLIVSLLCFFFCKEKWNEVLMLCGVMTLYISSGWPYTCVYMLPTLLMFFKEKNVSLTKSNLLDLIALGLFAVVFSVPIYKGSTIIYYAILLLVIIPIFKTGIRMLNERRQICKS